MSNGLFNMPTPEEVRRRIGRTGEERALNLAALPAGRGMVAAAGQAGGLLGRAGARLAGGVIPEEERAKRFQEIQATVQSEFGDDPIQDEDDFSRMMFRTGQLLQEGGFTNEAAQAFGAAGQAKRTASSRAQIEAQTATAGTTGLGNLAREVFGIGRGEELTPDAREWIKGVKELQAKKTQRKPTTVIPKVSKGERATVSEAVVDDDIKNEDVYINWIADRAKELQSQAKQQDKVLGFQDAMAQARAEALQKTRVEEGTFFDDVIFDPQAQPEGGNKTISFEDL
jgi:hypothetical protein